MYRAINLPVNNCYVLIHSSDILLIQESHQKPLLYFHNRNHKAAKILQTLELRTKPILDNHHSLELCVHATPYSDYTPFVTPKVKLHRSEELYNLFFKRMVEKKGFFKDNDLIKTNYEFAGKVIRESLCK